MMTHGKLLIAMIMGLISVSSCNKYVGKYQDKKQRGTGYLVIKRNSIFHIVQMNGMKIQSSSGVWKEVGEDQISLISDVDIQKFRDVKLSVKEKYDRRIEGEVKIILRSIEGLELGLHPYSYTLIFNQDEDFKHRVWASSKEESKPYFANPANQFRTIQILFEDYESEVYTIKDLKSNSFEIEIDLPFDPSVYLYTNDTIEQVNGNFGRYKRYRPKMERLKRIFR